MSEPKLADRPFADKRREDRRLAMIAAAESLFIERGYEDTTLAAIVQRSGGSLATLYDHFGNKQGLLRAMIERIIEEDELPVPSDPTPEQSCSDQLRHYAQALYVHFTRPRAIAIKRIVMTEALRDLNFARSLYQDLHVAGVEELALTFAKWTESGCAKFDKPLEAADLFFATIMGDAQLRFMCMYDEAVLSKADLDWRLDPFIKHFEVR